MRADTNSIGINSTKYQVVISDFSLIQVNRKIKADNGKVSATTTTEIIRTKKNKPNFGCRLN